MADGARRPIRLVLVDDHPVIRQGLIAILGAFDEVSVAGEASSGRDAVQVCAQLRPDVVLMDISMPDGNGIEAIAELRRAAPDCKALALSMHDNHSYVKQALRAGAHGYMLKDSSPRELVRAICGVHRGETFLSPQAAQTLTNNVFQRRGEATLTPREIEVLRFIARGLTNKEIGARLHLSVRTIESHRENLIRKSGRSTVAELTRYAVSLGYVELGAE